MRPVRLWRLIPLRFDLLVVAPSSRQADRWLPTGNAAPAA